MKKFTAYTPKPVLSKRRALAEQADQILLVAETRQQRRDRERKERLARKDAKARKGPMWPKKGIKPTLGAASPVRHIDPKTGEYIDG